MDLREFLAKDSLRNRHMKSVYQFIHKHGPITLSNIFTHMNFKQTTLVRMIDDLLHHGFIYEYGIEESSGGRPPILYKVVQDCSYIIGVDISRTQTTVALLDLNYTLIEKISFQMKLKHTPDIVISKIIQTIDQFLKKHQLTNDDILGIGIGAVGPIDREGGIILNPESFLSAGWQDVPIVRQLEEKFSVKVILENGANVAAFGEYTKATHMKNNILYCISGVGFRCGLLMNGQLMKKKTGDASSVGHMTIDVNRQICDHCHSGCLLSHISLKAMTDHIEDRMNQGEESVISHWMNDKLDQINLNDIVKACKLGDRLVNDVVLEAAYYFGIGIANIVNVMQPEHIILNGQLFYEHPPYFHKVVTVAKDHIYHTYDNIIFSKGVLKEDAVIVGAAGLLFQSYWL